MKRVTCWLALSLEYIKENLRYDNSKTLLLSTSLRSDNYWFRVWRLNQISWNTVHFEPHREKEVSLGSVFWKVLFTKARVREVTRGWEIRVYDWAVKSVSISQDEFSYLIHPTEKWRYRPFDIGSPIVRWHTCCRPWTTWACWVWIWTGVVAPLGDCTMVCWIWAGPLCCGNWTIRTWNWGCWSCVPIGTRGWTFVVVRFTVDVRAAMAVGEDPVANKQKQKLQLLKASKFSLLRRLVNWEKIFF